MGLDGNDLDQPMVRLQIEGGSEPNQRRVRTWLTVRQSQLSQAIQRIHRLGGKILEVQRAIAASEKAEVPTEDRAISDSLQSVSDPMDQIVDLEASPNPESAEVEVETPTAQSVKPQPLPVEEVKPLSPVYSLFPHGKVDPSRIPPVRRQRRKNPAKLKRQLPNRQLSLGKQRRQFFRCQPLKRRRRR